MLRCLLMMMCIASAVPASARTENPAVIELIEAAASHIASGTFNRAASAAERALRIEPESAWIWHLLARIHHLQSDYEMAHNMAEKSSSLAGNDVGLKAQNTWLITAADQASKRLKTGTGEGMGKSRSLTKLRDAVSISEGAL